MNMNLLCVILFAVVLMLVGVCLRQRRVIHNKNRAIVKFIDESIKYKKLYYSRVTRGQAPSVRLETQQEGGATATAARPTLLLNVAPTYLTHASPTTKTSAI